MKIIKNNSCKLNSQTARCTYCEDEGRYNNIVNYNKALKWETISQRT